MIRSKLGHGLVKERCRSGQRKDKVSSCSRSGQGHGKVRSRSGQSHVKVKSVMLRSGQVRKSTDLGQIRVRLR